MIVVVTVWYGDLGLVPVVATCLWWKEKVLLSGHKMRKNNSGQSTKMWQEIKHWARWGRFPSGAWITESPERWHSGKDSYKLRGSRWSLLTLQQASSLSKPPFPGLKPWRNSWGAYWTYQRGPGHQVLLASFSPATGSSWLAYSASYSKFLQPRSWAALPYMIQYFGYLVTLVYSLWGLMAVPPDSPLSSPFSSPFTSHGSIQSGHILLGQSSQRKMM